MPGMCGMALESRECRTPYAAHTRSRAELPPSCWRPIDVSPYFPSWQSALHQRQISGFLQRSIDNISSIQHPISLAYAFVDLKKKNDFRVLMALCCRCECRGHQAQRSSPGWRPCRGCTWAATPCPSASTTPTRP